MVNFVAAARRGDFSKALVSDDFSDLPAETCRNRG